MLMECLGRDHCGLQILTKKPAPSSWSTTLRMRYVAS